MRRWTASSLPSSPVVLSSLLAALAVLSAVSVMMQFTQSVPPLLVAAASYIAPGKAPAPHDSASCGASPTSDDINWYTPVKSSVNNVQTAVNGTGVYGFVFNSSQGPADTYNWCNMPHVNPTTYPKVRDSRYQLEYVEVIHRHHKRTPYASNTFPVESYGWDCANAGLLYGGKPINPQGNASASTFWNIYTPPSHPFAPAGFNGTCQFPQITRGGLDDSHQHGADLKAVYGRALGFIPEQYDPDRVSYRVTNNVITSQVASMVIAGMYPSQANRDTSLLVQPASIDSLEPAYSCPAASALFGSYGPGSSSPAWLEHVHGSADLYARLDALSGVDPHADDWHKSWDHYFDNLSSRLCHDHPLPCHIHNTADCVTMAEAEKVFRLGEYEYSFIYRDSSHSLQASVGSYGIWVAELAQNFRHAMRESSSSVDATSKKVRYRHNVAHDGSVSRLLAILQIDSMVWPGMGAEVVFELYSKDGCFYLRVLWGGQIMTSSHPSLGRLDLVPVDDVLAYFDALVGARATKIPAACQMAR